jgi:hypothetical protein
MGLGSGIRDLGSGKSVFRIPDPGVKKAPDPGSDPQHCCYMSISEPLCKVFASS